MFLRDYKQNLAAPLRFRGLSLVLITIEGAAVVEDESSPDVTVTDNADGTYSLTFPKGQYGFPLGAPAVVAQAGTAAGELTAFDATAGTATVDIGAAALSGTDRCYLAFLIGRA